MEYDTDESGFENGKYSLKDREVEDRQVAYLFVAAAQLFTVVFGIFKSQIFSRFEKGWKHNCFFSR